MCIRVRIFLARTTNQNVYKCFDEFKCTLALLLKHENEKLDCHFFKCSTKIQLTYILSFFIGLNVMMAKYLYNKPKCSLIKFLFFISKIRI